MKKTTEYLKDEKCMILIHAKPLRLEKETRINRSSLTEITWTLNN